MQSYPRVCAACLIRGIQGLIEADHGIGALEDSYWDLEDDGEDIVGSLGDGSPAYTLSFDARVNSLGASAKLSMRIGQGDTNGALKMIRLEWIGDQGAAEFEINESNDDGTIGSMMYAVGEYHHYDIVINRSGTALTDYSGIQDLATGDADIWINSELAVYGIDLNGYGFGGQDVERILFVSRENDAADVSFDNFEIRNEAYVLDPAFNPPPVVDAGPDQAIWPSDSLSAQLAGVISDAGPVDGISPGEGVTEYYWEQISGPDTATIDPAGVVVVDPPELSVDADATVTSSNALGTYEFMLQATDGDKDANDIVHIFVYEPQLIGHWPFDDDSDDYSVNDNHGVLWGTASLGADAAVGSRALLAGNPDGLIPEGRDPNIVYLGPAPELDIKTVPPQFSASAWIKTTNSLTGTIISKGGEYDGGIRWILDTSGGRTRLTTDDNNVKLDGLGYTDVDDGAWHFVVATCDGETIRLYVDGVFDGPDENSDVPDDYDLSGSSQKDGYIGAAISNEVTEPNDVRSLFDGLIDDVRVYNYMLPLDDPTYESILSLAAMGPIVASVDAGDDEVFPWKPGRELDLNGVVTDLGINPEANTILWTTVSGPDIPDANAVFAPADAAVTTAAFPAAGVYVLQLTVTDPHAPGDGTVSDEIEVTVVAPTCADALADGLGLPGDVAGGGAEGDEPDCYVGLVDLVAILANWPDCNIPLDDDCIWPF